MYMRSELVCTSRELTGDLMPPIWLIHYNLTTKTYRPVTFFRRFTFINPLQPQNTRIAQRAVHLRMEPSVRVGIIMGSQSDLPVLAPAAEVLRSLGIGHEVNIVSAHRTPLRMVEYAQQAADRGLQVIIAGAGGAAHLPGMVASLTLLPVIGVPVKSRNSIDGWDSLLSIVQMPAGVPVATVAVDGGANAGILAAQIIASTDASIRRLLQAYRDSLREKVEAAARQMEEQGWEGLMSNTAL